MTIQQLKYIVALDTERHFARAAEVSMVSQPGLTIQLKNLEEEIGIKIFDRNKVPLKPTELGLEIIARAKKILREVDEMRDFVINEKNSMEGQVNLGVISTLSPYLIPLFIKEITKVAPKLHFTISESNTVQLMKDLETGTIDIALMATPTGNSNLKEHPVFNEPFVAYLYPEHPMSKESHFKMISEDNTKLLLLQKEYCYNAQLVEICELKENFIHKDRFSYEITSIETLKNMVRAELGIAIIPELSILNEKDTVYYKPLEDPKPVREISLVVNDTFSRKKLLEVMSKAIWECLPKAMKENFAYKKIRWNDSPYFIKALG
jgi:LysR family transcriptional regulator, hydrogen peroxide-inducible genes activator